VGGFIYGRLKAEAGTHSVRVITSANQILIADMGVEELLHRHIAVNPDLCAAKIIFFSISEINSSRNKSSLLFLIIAMQPS